MEAEKLPGNEGDGMGGGELGTAQPVAQREQRREDDRDEDRRPRKLCCDRDRHEHARAQDRAEPEQHRVEHAQLALEGLVLRRRVRHRGIVGAPC